MARRSIIQNNIIKLAEELGYNVTQYPTGRLYFSKFEEGRNNFNELSTPIKKNTFDYLEKRVLSQEKTIKMLFKFLNIEVVTTPENVSIEKRQ